MSTTCYLLVPHARDATCADLTTPTHWPRGAGSPRVAEFEVGVRFTEALARVDRAALPADEAAVLTRLCALELDRGVRTRLALPVVLAALERADASARHPRLRRLCAWLREHLACATEVILDVHCNTSGIYDDEFVP